MCNRPNFGQFRETFHMTENWKTAVENWANRIPLPKRYVMVALLIGEIGYVEESILLYNHAKGLYESFGDAAGVAAVLQHLVNIERRKGNATQAKEMLTQAREIFEKLAFKPGIATTLASLAMIERDTAVTRGNYEEAARLFDAARDMYIELKDESQIAAVNHNEAILETNRGNYDKARELAAKALVALQNLGEMIGAANAQSVIGDVEYREGKYDEARRRFEETHDLSEKLQYRPGILATGLRLAAIERKLGNPERAERLALQCLEISRRSKNPSGTAESFGLLGTIRESRGMLKEAKADFSEALSIFIRLGDKRGEDEARRHLMRLGS
jgi:tetratricopeptide (TPR) repeat protein